MCSVTFWPTREGYLLGMNRDEARTRPVALPPETFRIQDRRVTHPREPSGGTWIALDDHGTAFALINWYSIPALPLESPLTRGEVILAVRSGGVAAVESVLGSMELSRVRPFRLVGISLATRSVLEWRWDQRTLLSIHHPWSPSQWFSSGYDEAGVQRSRAAALLPLMEASDRGTVGWMRRVHGSHDPTPGPYSICMHRADASTVSYTELEVDSRRREIRYVQGAPCELERHAPWRERSLAISPEPQARRALETARPALPSDVYFTTPALSSLPKRSPLAARSSR